MKIGLTSKQKLQHSVKFYFCKILKQGSSNKEKMQVKNVACPKMWPGISYLQNN